MDGEKHTSIAAINDISAPPCKYSKNDAIGLAENPIILTTLFLPLPDIFNPCGFCLNSFNVVLTVPILSSLLFLSQSHTL